MIKFLKSIMNIIDVAMVARDLIKSLVTSHLKISDRLKDIVSSYVMSLILESPKHTQTFHRLKVTVINHSNHGF